MNSLGIYFGPKTINIVETKGKKLISNIQIPQSSLASGDLDEQLPIEVKLVAIFNDELRKNRIDVNKATLCLSGKDLIIRTFEMPVLPDEELSSAVNFEAKKYIPFKVEELITDYQVELDRSSRKNSILFVGIKKETLDKYLAIFAQLNIKLLSIEYSDFSLLRALRLCGAVDSGIVGVFGMDAQEVEEASFTVFENSFPLFSRDFSVGSAGLESPAAPREPQAAATVEKLKSEIRVSLDYYQRKFPNKKIKKVFLVANQEYASELESFITEIGLVSQFVNQSNLARVTGKAVAYSLSFIKGYSAALAEGIKSGLKINILASKEKVTLAQKQGARGSAASLFEGIKFDFRVISAGLLICALAYAWGLYQAQPLRKEIQAIVDKRAKVTSVSPDASYDALEGVNAKYKMKFDALNNIVIKQLFATYPLNIIPGALPEGMWLSRFNLVKGDDGKAELTLEGVVYLNDPNKEIMEVNEFLSNLNGDATFSKYFNDIKVTSMDRRLTEKVMVTNFTILCSSKQGSK
ncbi:MAG: pilus assembly protein PilM [Candidatus Omnitrophica bacterium]|nr:pilus assembly protein PilM [Candidatus Omnitrophota bacterium]